MIYLVEPVFDLRIIEFGGAHIFDRAQGKPVFPTRVIKDCLVIR